MCKGLSSSNNQMTIVVPAKSLRPRDWSEEASRQASKAKQEKQASQASKAVSERLANEASKAKQAKLPDAKTIP